MFKELLQFIKEKYAKEKAQADEAEEAQALTSAAYHRGYAAALMRVQIEVLRHETLRLVGKS
jgi:hypothetical protein